MRKFSYILFNLLLFFIINLSFVLLVSGSSMVINTPNTDVLKQGQFSLEYHYIESKLAFKSFNINLLKNLELGFTSDFYNNSNTFNSLSARFNVINNTIATPGIAIGIEGITTKNLGSAYVVASKALPMGFKINTGVGNKKYKNMFVSLEKNINLIDFIDNNHFFPAISVICEYDGNKINCGGSIEIISKLKANFGVRENFKQKYFSLTYTN